LSYLIYLDLKHDAHEGVVLHLEVVQQQGSRCQLREIKEVEELNWSALLARVGEHDSLTRQGFRFGSQHVIQHSEYIFAQAEIYLVHLLVVVQNLPEERKEVSHLDCFRNHRKDTHDQLLKQLHGVIHINTPVLLLLAQVNEDLLELVDVLRFDAAAKFEQLARHVFLHHHSLVQ